MVDVLVGNVYLLVVDGEGLLVYVAHQGALVDTSLTPSLSLVNVKLKEKILNYNPPQLC